MNVGSYHKFKLWNPLLYGKELSFVRGTLGIYKHTSTATPACKERSVRSVIFHFQLMPFNLSYCEKGELILGLCYLLAIRT